MPETSSSARSTNAEFYGTVRKAFEQAADAFLPPPEARRHFRQARVEIWKGIRELVDRRINDLSREDDKGSRVVVE